VLHLRLVQPQPRTRAVAVAVADTRVQQTHLVLAVQAVQV